MDDNQIRLVSFQLLPNSQVQPHEESEIHHLVKKGILPKHTVEYNKMVPS